MNFGWRAVGRAGVRRPRSLGAALGASAIRFLLLLPLCVPALVLAAEWTTRPLSEIAIYPEFRVPASVVARDEARMAAEVSARVVAMPVREGESAARGAELVRLDESGFRIEAKRARARLALVENRIRLARVQLEQSRALADKGFISADGLRVKETELAVLGSERDAALAEVQAADLALERTVVRAPFAGVVRERSANVGDLAAVGSALLSFAASSDAEVRAQVPDSQVSELRAGSRLVLHAGDEVHPLQIRRISPVLERAGQVREVVLSAALALPPGLAGEVRWRSATPHLPPAYLQRRGDVLGVYVEREGRAAFVAVPNAHTGRAAAVKLSPDTAVIDEGRFALGLGEAGK